MQPVRTDRILRVATDAGFLFFDGFSDDNRDNGDNWNQRHEVTLQQ